MKGRQSLSMTANQPQRITLKDDPLEPLTEAALEWQVRLHSGDATDSDQAAYHTWREASPAHQAAAMTAERLWQSLGPAAPRPRPLKRVAGLAVVLVALVGAMAGTGTFGPPASWIADHSTGTGERRTLQLADGSRLDLDAATRLDVDFDGDRRRVTLHSGTIHITVAPDAARPFEVEAAGGIIRALGTQFDVRRQHDEVRVAVTEHAVRVRYPVTGTEAVDLAAGHKLRYGKRTGLGTPASADLQALTAWRRGYMAFDGRQLGEVIAEMGRYRGGFVLIRDRALYDLPVTGLFPTDDAEGLLDAIAATLPVRIRRFPLITVIDSQHN